jgi:predicted nucleic acid-binding protein
VTPVVVDTDVLSFIFEQYTRAALYLPDLENRAVMISFMTEAEMERWALQAGWTQPRQIRLRELLKRFVIAPSSEALSRTWASVMIESRAAGRRMETADAWIAATALLYKAGLVTNNPSDFRMSSRFAVDHTRPGVICTVSILFNCPQAA